MTYFRQRVGSDAIQKIFDGVVAQARGMGLVRDRLRLKDATHVIANIAIPTTIRLVAETRDAVLEAAEPFAKEQVEYEWQRADGISELNDDLPDTERLVRRVAHLRSVLLWVDELPSSEAFRAGDASSQEKLRAALKLGHKVLCDRDDPQAGDKLRSIHDPDARCPHQTALMVAHAQLKLNYALWRQAYRRLGWNPRAVVLDMIAPSTLWSDTQARIAHYTHAFANMNAVVDACIEDIRERYNIAKRDVTDGCCPHRHATASRATSPALRAMEENHRSLSSLAVRRGRWIAASSQRDGGGSHSCRGPPTPQQNQQFPTRPHKRERTRMRAA